MKDSTKGNICSGFPSWNRRKAHKILLKERNLLSDRRLEVDAKLNRGDVDPSATTGVWAAAAVPPRFASLVVFPPGDSDMILVRTTHWSSRRFSPT